MILRKVDKNYGPLEGKEFTIYKGSSETAFKPQGAAKELSELKSQANGVYWIGTLPSGWYIVEETSPAPSKFFYIIIDETGDIGTLYKETDSSPEKDKIDGYGTRDAANTAAMEKFGAIQDAKKAKP